MLVQGDSYFMSGNGLDIFCDGESVWTVDHDALEAVVETAENVTGAALGNPALLIVRLDELFYVRNASSSGNRYRYELSAKEDCGIKKADVDVTSAGILLGGEFSMSDGTDVKVEVVSMKSLMNKPSGAFRRLCFRSGLDCNRFALSQPFPERMAMSLTIFLLLLRLRRNLLRSLRNRRRIHLRMNRPLQMGLFRR